MDGSNVQLPAARVSFLHQIEFAVISPRLRLEWID